MAQKEFPCKQCGAQMAFDPDAAAVKCPYCGCKNAIPQSEADVAERDYLAALSTAAGAQDLHETLTVKCSSCGAQTTLDPNITADACPFCGGAIVAGTQSARQIKPQALLPFHISGPEALKAFASWIKGLWFAPGALKTYARTESSRMSGMYVPYWTYDCNTTCFYRGQRGEYYYVTETYTERVNGKTVTKTRRVRKIRWWPCSGVVYNSFDDLLVLASRSLPRKYTDRLEPWDLENLAPHDDQYLAGFRTESYQVDLPQGFETAKSLMEPVIRESCEQDIGGDEQRVDTISIEYRNITFKHILLPVWISVYRFKQTVYRFLVNARTGEVQGERPWSWVKITAAVIAALAVIVTIAYFASRS